MDNTLGEGRTRDQLKRSVRCVIEAYGVRLYP